MVNSCITGSSAADVGVVFRGAFVVVVASELVTDFDTKTDTKSFDKGANAQITQESSFGLAPVMAAFIQVLFDFSAFLAKAKFCVQMYSSYRNCLFQIMDKFFEACSLVGHYAPIDNKMGVCISTQHSIALNTGITLVLQG
jgi:hypothetical protein